MRLFFSNFIAVLFQSKLKILTPMKRRNFLLNGSFAIGGLTLSHSVFPTQLIPFNTIGRPAVNNRGFSSPAVESLLAELTGKIERKELAQFFDSCFPFPLDRLVDYSEKDGQYDTFVGNADAKKVMWLKEATFQVWPYLSLVKEDEALQHLFKGIINRQIQLILTDSYTNGFEKENSSISATPKSYDRFWKMTSLTGFAALTYQFFKQTQDKSIFTEDCRKVLFEIFGTLRVEQQQNAVSPYFATSPSEGFFSTSKAIGLIPSDSTPSKKIEGLPYDVAANLHAVATLENLAIIFEEGYGEPAHAKACQNFASEIQFNLHQSAAYQANKKTKIYFQSIDGNGQHKEFTLDNCADIASLAYLYPEFKDEIYENTLQQLLSESRKLNITSLKSMIFLSLADKEEHSEYWINKIIKKANYKKSVVYTPATFDFSDLSEQAEKLTANVLFGELIYRAHS